MRAEADRKAEIARFLLTLNDVAFWSDLKAMVQKRFGKKGTSKPILRTILKTVKEVDPINFAPALLATYKGRTATAVTSDEACSFL